MASPTRNNSILSQTPAAIIPPPKNLLFPRKNASPLCFADIKATKNHFGESEQKIAKHRKSPDQTAVTPEKCSTIHPQQFVHGLVKYGTSRPRIVQQFNQKMNNKDHPSSDAFTAPTHFDDAKNL
ncbi:MAG: hypothetical protein JXB10_10895 [Pirellulales bacterium]|nr:hypothetical protein [Pirellulales bacterium]